MMVSENFPELAAVAKGRDTLPTNDAAPADLPPLAIPIIRQEVRLQG